MKRTNLSMSSAAHIIDRARHAAAYLVSREQRTVGSRMAAYDRVGSMVGTSSSWLRKFIGRNPDVRASLVVGFNLIQIYEQVVARVEQAADNERLRAAVLEAQYEADKSDPELVRRMASAQETTAHDPRKPGED